MLPLEVIKKYYPNLSDEELKKIQVFVYELCCGLMQYFYGKDWEKDIDVPDLKNQEGWYDSLIISSNPARSIAYGLKFEGFLAKSRG